MFYTHMHPEALLNHGMKLKSGGLTCSCWDGHLFHVVETPCQHTPPHRKCVAFSSLISFGKNHAVQSRFIYCHHLGVKFQTADFLLASLPPPHLGRQGIT